MPRALHCFFDRNDRSLNTRGSSASLLAFGLAGRGTLNQFKQIDQLIVRQTRHTAQRNPACVHNARTLCSRQFHNQSIHTYDGSDGLIPAPGNAKDKRRLFSPYIFGDSTPESARQRPYHE